MLYKTIKQMRVFLFEDFLIYLSGSTYGCCELKKISDLIGCNKLDRTFRHLHSYVLV